MKTITSIRILPGQRALALDVRGHTLFDVGLLELLAEHATEKGFQAQDALCELDSLDRWRVVKRDGKWSTERA